MGLRAKIIIFLVILVFLTIFSQYFLFRNLIDQYESDHEHRLILQKVSRCQLALKMELKELKLIADAQKMRISLLLASDPKLLTENSVNLRESLLKNNLNIIVFFNRDEQLIFGRAYDFSSQESKLFPLDSSFVAQLTSVENPKAAFAVINDQIVALAAISFDGSKTPFPDAKWLFIGRIYNNTMMTQLRKKVGINFHISPLKDSELIAKLEMEHPLVIPDNQNKLSRAFDLVDTISGKTKALVTVDHPETFLFETGSQPYFLSVFFLIIGALTALSMAVFFQYLVLKPLTRLTNQMLTIRNTSIIPDTVELDRSDEIGTLSSEFNRLLKWSQARTDEQSLLGELDNLLAACNSIEEACNVFNRVGSKFFSDKQGALSIRNHSGNLYEITTSWGGQWPGDQVFFSDDCWSLRRGQPHLSAEATPSPLCKHLPVVFESSVLCVPLVAQGDTLGVFHLMADSIDFFDDVVIRLAESLAEHASLAIVNLRLRESLRLKSIRDPLTNLFNRRYLVESLEREISRSKRKEENIGVMMIDIDHFKIFNDSFGHEAGDFVLKQLGLALSQFVRKEDIACRYGGEEFTLILPNTSLEISQKRAEQLCDRIRKVDLRFQNKSLVTLTLSIGVSVFPDHGELVETLIGAADQALYRAKHEGRNRVLTAD